MINTLFLTCSHFNPEESELALLRETYPNLQLNIVNEESYTLEQIAKAEILVGFPRPQDLKHAKNLRWLQTPSAGVGQYAEKSLFAHNNIKLTSAVGVYGRQIADHVIGMMIAQNNYLFTYREQMKQQHWERYFPKKDLWSSTILIIGLGDIGMNLAIRAKAHGMYVIAIKRTKAEKPECVDELYTSEAIDQLLPRADYIALCVASTPDTEKMLNRYRISLMSKEATLINVARGSLVDEEALIEALESNQIRGALLDVTEIEPLPKQSKLWHLPNVLITPHAAGLSYSDPHQVFSIFFDNVGKYLNDQPLHNLVDFDQKY